MQHVSASYCSACICSTVDKHTLACNRHKIKCFLLQESTDQKFLWVCLLHSIVISLVSEYHHHPLMMHLSTHQDISLGQKIVHVHHLEKHLMGQVAYILQKNTNCFVAIKSDFMSSSIVTTNIQKTLQPTKHIYHQQTLDDSQPYFPQCIPHWLIPAGFIQVNSK